VAAGKTSLQHFLRGPCGARSAQSRHLPHHPRAGRPVLIRKHRGHRRRGDPRDLVRQVRQISRNGVQDHAVSAAAEALDRQFRSLSIGQCRKAEVSRAGKGAAGRGCVPAYTVRGEHQRGAPVDLQDARQRCAVLAGSRQKTDWIHPFDAGVTRAFFDSMKTNFSDWRNGLEAERKRRSAEFKETLEEYYDIFL